MTQERFQVLLRQANQSLDTEDHYGSGFSGRLWELASLSDGIAALVEQLTACHEDKEVVHAMLEASLGLVR